MRNIGTLVADEVGFEAQWRLQKAEEFPAAADRDLQSATSLFQIESDLHKLEGSQPHWRLEALCARNCERYSEILHQLIRKVGFGCAARTGPEFLDCLFFLLESWDLDGGGVVLPLSGRSRSSTR
jgi:hypothetical protein